MHFIGCGLSVDDLLSNKLVCSTTHRVVQILNRKPLIKLLMHSFFSNVCVNLLAFWVRGYFIFISTAII